MLCVRVGDVMDVVFLVCIVMRGAVGTPVSSRTCYTLPMVSLSVV